jgi:uncharacterized protein (DUF1800 family)
MLNRFHIEPTPMKIHVKFMVSAALALLLTSCGGGGGGGGSSGGGSTNGGGVSTGGTTGGTTGGGTGDTLAATLVKPQSDGDTARFLGQGTFGGNSADIAALRGTDYAAWFETQFSAPRYSHTAYLDAEAARLAPGATLNNSHVVASFWKGVGSAPDTLRQRLVFALSQIFVISMVDAAVADFDRGVGNYMDMLGDHAFGNYRQLLEAVSLHPMMGLYLSHLRNRKEQGTRVPDQNYAREVMQLFSIGLYELNDDGTLRRNATGQPIETYAQNDIVGLSRVFTGFSWAGPDATDARFNGNASARDPNRDILPMRAYPQHHSILEKKFLGRTIPPQTVATADAPGDLRIALDTLAAHPNVGPFIGRQLIQRLVASNPSTAYVGRVASAFNTGRFTQGSWTVGTGNRGDMKAMIVAVLMDPEARGVSAPPAASAVNAVGKVREPIARMAAWMRAFNARSIGEGQRWLLGTTDDPATSLGQSAMHSPSVFNFYRPGYVPPNTAIAGANLVAPEFQILHESSVVGYANFMRTTVRNGVGTQVPSGPGTTLADIQPDYAAELALATTPAALVERVNLLLAGGTMSAETIADITATISAIPIPSSTQNAIDSAKRDRVHTAVLLGVIAAEFVVQR